MPTYEYLCLECGNRIEVVQSFSDEALQTCDACGGKLRKVIYPVGIQFKGSGFYSTDRRASQPRPRSRAEGKAEAGSDSKSDAAASDKSEKKSDKESKGAGDKSAGEGGAKKAAPTGSGAAKS